MIEIDKPKIEIVDVSTVGSCSTGRFVVEPLLFRDMLSLPLRLMVFYTNFQQFRTLRKMLLRSFLTSKMLS